MDPEDLANILLIAPELLSDEDLMLIMLADLENTQIPTHYKYPRFNENDLSEEEFEKYFRFKRDDVYLLKNHLNLQDCYKAGSKIKWSAIEGICILLRRLAYPNRLCDLVPLFGRHKTELSIIVNVMLNEVYRKTHHTVENVNQQWLDHEVCARVVHGKGAVLDNVWAFIDGTQGRLCRPHKGQESIFNGHKRIHSLKYQSVVAPNGMIVHFYGPIEGRRHDSALYYDSGIDDKIANITDSNGRQLAIFGDSAYAFRRYLLTPFKGAALTQQQKDFNTNMSSVRACVEWGFSKITNIFAFLSFHKNLKVYLQPVAKYWIVAAVLTNCHTCLYGSQTGTYFDLQPPSLEEYLA